MKAEELERQYSPGQLILERGKVSRELFIVRSGGVLLDRDDGSEARLIGAGELFGELSAVLGAPNPYSAEADDDVAVLVLDPDLLNQMCTENEEFAVRMIRHLSEELLRCHGDRASLAGMDQRMAQGFKKIVPVLFARAQGDEPPVPVEGRLKDLSGEAGLSVLDAYYCIQRLLESRVLRLVEDQLAIVEAEQLRELLGQQGGGA